jgi:hypothetical protein
MKKQPGKILKSDSPQFTLPHEFEKSQAAFLASPCMNVCLPKKHRAVLGSITHLADKNRLYFAAFLKSLQYNWAVVCIGTVLAGAIFQKVYFS